MRRGIVMPVEAATQAKPELYSKDLLRLAAALPHADRLTDPTGTASVRSPVCGSEITADISIDQHGRIAALAFRARACAIGQASAALLRGLGIRQSIDQIAAMRTALADALAGNGSFAALAPELAVFKPVRAHPGRHAAILLPYEAILAAAGRA